MRAFRHLPLSRRIETKVLINALHAEDLRVPRFILTDLERACRDEQHRSLRKGTTVRFLAILDLHNCEHHSDIQRSFFMAKADRIRFTTPRKPAIFPFYPHSVVYIWVEPPYGGGPRLLWGSSEIMGEQNFYGRGVNQQLMGATYFRIPIHSL